MEKYTCKRTFVSRKNKKYKEGCCISQIEYENLLYEEQENFEIRIP